MATESHAFAGWPLELDPFVFDMYLAGYNAKVCADEVIALLLEPQVNDQLQLPPRRQTTPKTSPTSPMGGQSKLLPPWIDLMDEGDRRIILHDVQDHYRIIDYIIPYLHSPTGFVTQQHVPLSYGDKLEMIRRYYWMDEYLAFKMFGSKLGKADVDVLVAEVQELGYTEETIVRLAENIKRISRFLSNGYRSKEGHSIPQDQPIHSAIEKQFVVPPELASRLATLCFAFEHHLDTNLLPQLGWSGISTVCSACAAALCDESMLMVKEPVYVMMSRLKVLLSDSKVIHELHRLVFGEAPVKRLFPLNVGVGPYRAGVGSEPHASPNGNLNNTQRESTPAAQSTPSVHAPGSFPANPSPQPAEGSLASTPNVPSPPAALASSVISPPNVSPTVSTVSTANPLSFPKSQFPILLKALGKVAATFSSKKDLGQLLDLLHEKVLLPFGAGVSSNNALHCIPATETAARGYRDLAALAALVGTQFGNLHMVSKEDHEFLDAFVVDFCMMIRLLAQISLSRIGSEQSNALPSVASMGSISTPLLPGRSGSASAAPQTTPTTSQPTLLKRRSSTVM